MEIWPGPGVELPRERGAGYETEHGTWRPTDWDHDSSLELEVADLGKRSTRKIAGSASRTWRKRPGSGHIGNQWSSASRRHWPNADRTAQGASAVSVDEQTEEIPYADEEFWQHPHEWLAQRRESGAVCPMTTRRGIPSYLVSGYEQARELLNDPRVSKDSADVQRVYAAKAGQEVQGPDFGNLLTRHMLNSDPPVHTRLRKLVNKAFTARTVARLRPRIQEIADSLLAEMARHEQVDLVRAFAEPLPITVICELLGVRVEDRGEFTAWSHTLLSFSEDPECQAAAARDMQNYLRQLVESKRAEPAEDLLSDLVHASDEGDSLDEDELISMAFLLLVAGHETTVNLIANATFALLRAPEQAEKLRADPGLLPGAVEEFLRFDGPINFATLRYTVEEIEAGGVTVPTGEFMHISLLSANRDPEKFPDPDTLDVTRAPGGHLAFGHGIHYCVGAPLARLEAQIALGSLLARFPELSLAVPAGDIVYRPSSLVHGVLALPVRLKGA
ncbi:MULTISPECIES: cytochrome P450 [Amycolatopsis]|uniref:cytochrome P450 family protein n=1 Tax=Amycolatopsis TaxID=1813 RepID=UPI0007DEF70D|nr:MULTISPECIES: cytochrome P450 [Amycolatopsis]OAP28167.1 Cytochrome P450 107B1 [Amycolatopsis sp. M39]